MEWLAPELVNMVRQLLTEGLSEREVQRRVEESGMSVSKGTIHNIKHRKYGQRVVLGNRQPRRVEPYRCTGCGRFVELSPCQICRVKEPA